MPVLSSAGAHAGAPLRPAVRAQHAAPLRSLEDLVRLRRDAKQLLRSRLQTGTRITVGMGTCGLAAGAGQTLQAIREELASRQIDAQVVSVGCIGQCVKEPLVDIEQAGQPRVTYGSVRPDMVPRLIEEHLVNNRPVQEWVVGRLSYD